MATAQTFPDPVPVNPGAANTFTGMINALPATPASTRAITTEETAAGQLNNMLADNSTYIQSARANGMIVANSRGGINSGLAAGISEKAAIDAAAPIAAQDAATYAASGLSAQNANQNAEQTKLTGGVTSVNQAQNLYNAAETQAQQGEITSDLQAQRDTATSDLQTSLKQMDVNVDISKISAANMSAYVNAVSPVMTKYQEMVAGIQTQPDSNITPDAKAVALANLRAIYMPQIQSISNIYGYQVDWGTA